MEKCGSPRPEWTVLINPRAGRAKGREDWRHLFRLLDQRGIRYCRRFTEYPRHGLALTQAALEAGYRKFIIVGGDGLLSEAVNGIFTQTAVDPAQVTLALIPAGTGNDWARTFAIPFDFAAAIDTILDGKTLPHDIGQVYYQEGTGERSWHFINMCGLGFDAEVNKKVARDRDRGRLGPGKYRYHLFTTLIGYAPTKMALTIDGQTTCHDVFSMAVGNAQYNGGGMRQLPSAKPDDGLLDVTVIKPITRLKVMRSVQRLYDGSFVELPEVSTYTGKVIHVSSEPPCRIEADGEALGESPFRFEICPQKLNLIIR